MISYYTTTNVYLSLEQYYNAGVTPEQAKETIEKMADPTRVCGKLYCRPSGINRNWNFSLQTNNPNIIDMLIYEIEDKLHDLIPKNKKNKIYRTERPKNFCC